MDQQPDTNKIGRTFTWLSWIVGLGLVVLLFDELLGYQYNPNQDLKSERSSRGQVSVTLLQNRYGHYVLNGEINQQQVTFLLDTGATSVSIPEHIAKQLYLEPQGSYLVNTANGRIKVYRTTLSTLRIGEITLYNVAANINPAMDSDEILLGMSALKQVEFSQTGNQLIIREQR
ncbi:TIGR02281 family clan AA aspartic protease [Thalassotalea sp. LPB0316]|uniref:retropepsin-like aspartic protease family protein n=1 Tax=Thalassotalea sp. LPB0316 TaxID=2769490 RepID=UPI0018678519|nr:TIGR02281 family clan AA aspartic protease [Thalassotalea sp. LPB0316]QOL25885.1 TIGR02281 family clan AA aspartic protease [Thalassotalea sp. LPB0316]